MAIGKQEKILTDKQQNLTLTYLEGTRHQLRNKVIFMLSFKAGLRANEIAKLKWSMVCNSDGEVSNVINLSNNASKGKYSGRIIPLHKELKTLLMELLKQQRQNEFFSLAKAVINTERGQSTTAQAIVNFSTICIKALALSAVPRIVEEELLLQTRQNI